MDSFTNKAQFNAGFSERLKLKDDAVLCGGGKQDRKYHIASKLGIYF